MKWISLIIGGIIIVAGIWILFNPSSVISPAINEIKRSSITNNKETNTVTQNKYGFIEYTDTGFNPEKISIKKGETVTFKNNSRTGMWIASNPHPIHNQYPEKSPSDCLGSTFDACKVLSPGESWKFKFNKVGLWGYHNHIRPVFGGEIEVK